MKYFLRNIEAHILSSISILLTLSNLNQKFDNRCCWIWGKTYLFYTLMSKWKTLMYCVIVKSCIRKITENFMIYLPHVCAHHKSSVLSIPAVNSLTISISTIIYHRFPLKDFSPLSDCFLFYFFLLFSISHSLCLFTFFNVVKWHQHVQNYISLLIFLLFPFFLSLADMKDSMRNQNVIKQERNHNNKKKSPDFWFSQ
jgi:hypothetical protein